MSVLLVASVSSAEPEVAPARSVETSGSEGGELAEPTAPVRQAEPSALNPEPRQPWVLPQPEVPEAIVQTPESIEIPVPPLDRGVEVALRGSYGALLGGAGAEGDLRDVIVGMIPVQVDFGYRFHPQWFVGGYAAAGIGVKGEECRGRNEGQELPDGTEIPGFGVKCDAPDNFRVGVQLLYHLLPVTAKVSPWIGLGVGYEWLNISETLGRRTFVQTFSGFEFMNWQLGVDFGVGSRLKVGPFAQWTLGHFRHVSSDADAEADPLPVPETVHQWLQFGIKATVGPLGG